MDWFRPFWNKQTKLGAVKPRWKLLDDGKLQSPRLAESHHHTKNNDYPKRNRYNQYLYPVIAAVLSVSSLPLNAETVGGVSATANPIANSSGSVTNQAIQVLQGPYIQNGYGDGIVCQGPTANFTPYVTRNTSWQFPYEANYSDPVYNMLDLIGDTDSSGNAIPDGIPDNPGEILYYRDVRTGQKDNYNWNAGFSATISWPLDREAQKLCKEAAKNHNALRAQMVSNRRLEFELTRLSKCGELAQKGIIFHPKSPYHAICADVVSNTAILQSTPHTHTIPSTDASVLQDLSLSYGDKN